MAVRDTQVVLEVLTTDASPNVRSTQMAVEVAYVDGIPNFRCTQMAVEVLLKLREQSNAIINIIT